MFLREPIPVDFELESISEPTSIDVLLYDPEVLVVNLDGQWCWFLLMQDCVGLRFGEDINMENIVNPPLRRQL
jgi:hypothetical protein